MPEKLALILLGNLSLTEPLIEAPGIVKMYLITLSLKDCMILISFLLFFTNSIAVPNPTIEATFSVPERKPNT